MKLSQLLAATFLVAIVCSQSQVQDQEDELPGRDQEDDALEENMGGGKRESRRNPDVYRRDGVNNNKNGKEGDDHNQPISSDNEGDSALQSNKGPIFIVACCFIIIVASIVTIMIYVLGHLQLCCKCCQGASNTINEFAKGNGKKLCIEWCTSVGNAIKDWCISKGKAIKDWCISASNYLT